MSGNTKRLTVACCAALFIFAALWTRAWAGESSADEAKRLSIRLAAAKAAEAAIREMESKEIQDAEEQLLKLILGNTAEHKMKADSMAILQKRYVAIVQGELEKTLEGICKQFNPGKDNWFDAKWLSDYVSSKYAEKREKAIGGNHEKFYGDVFAAARAGAVHEQTTALAKEVYPEAADVDALDRVQWKQDVRDELRSRLVDALTKKIGAPLLEEVEVDAAAIAEAGIADAKNQVDMQRQVIRNASPSDNVLSREQLDEFLRTELQDKIAVTRNSRPGKKVYDPLQSVLAEIPAQAEAMEKEKFRIFLERREYEINPDSLRLFITGDYERSRKFDDSAAAAYQHFQPAFVDESVATYGKRFKEEADRPAFQKRLEELITNDDACRNALRDGMTRCIDSALKEVRPKLAEEQLSRHFPMVVSRELQIAEPFLKNAVTTNAPLTVESCLNIPSVSEKGTKADPSKLLEETEPLVVQKCGELVKEGKDAWNGQLNLLEDYDATMTDTIRSDARRKAAKSAESYIRDFTRAIEEQWKARRRAILWAAANPTPPNADVKYADLFRNTRDRIEQLVKSKLKLINDELEAERVREVARVAEEARRAEKALRDEEARKEEEARRAEQALKDEEARRRADEARKAEEARLADEARKAAEASKAEEERKAAGAAQAAEAAKAAQQGDGTGSPPAGQRTDVGQPEDVATGTPAGGAGPDAGGTGQGTQEGDAGGEGAGGTEVRGSRGLLESLTIPLLLFILLAILIYVLREIWRSYSRYRDDLNRWQFVVTMPVDDIEKAMKFYEDFPQSEPISVPNDKSNTAVVRVGGTYIELVKRTEHTPPVGLSVAAMKPEKPKEYFAKSGFANGDSYMSPGGTPVRIRGDKEFFRSSAQRT